MGNSLQDNNVDNGVQSAWPGANHGKNEADDVEQCLEDVGEEEKLGAQGASGALDDADEIEDQTDEDDDHDDDRGGHDGFVCEVGVVLVNNPPCVILVHPQAGNEEGVDTNLDKHDQDADDPEGDEHPLEEWRRVADDVLFAHDCETVVVVVVVARRDRAISIWGKVAGELTLEIQPVAKVRVPRLLNAGRCGSDAKSPNPCRTPVGSSSPNGECRQRWPMAISQRLLQPHSWGELSPKSIHSSGSRGQTVPVP